jgi:hypothetical protein
MFVTEELVKVSLENLNLSKVRKLDISKVMSRFVKGDISDQNRIQCKNNLLVHLFESQNLPADFVVEGKYQCKACNGRGFDMALFETEYVDCPLIIITKNGKTTYSGCNGTGWKISECSKCHGKGLIGNVPCPTCINKKTGIASGIYCFHPTKDRKERKGYSGKKCLVCGGSGKIKKIVQRESIIKDISPCKKCSGSGISKEIGTVVINKNLGELIKSKVKTTSNKVEVSS